MKKLWYNIDCCFGLHYDLHANAADTELGKRCSPEELTEFLKIIRPDFVQTDCKGHPGYTSWFSKTPNASVPPDMSADALANWREATRRLNLPLHCHYSGIWNNSAAQKFPEWRVVHPAGKTNQAADMIQNGGVGYEQNRMCPRSDYLEQLMIPQLIELLDDYQVDGFWVDGDIWAARPCYCPKCKSAFSAETGIAEQPESESDPHWPKWWQFTLRSFEDYVKKYTDAVHHHRPDAKVCSNWLYSFQNPGEPKIGVDWISGDNPNIWGLDASRCEARFISTRGKPWDIMLWSFFSPTGHPKSYSPWCFKPVQTLMQEAAVSLSYGGNIQIYETVPELRDGRLVKWRAEELRKVRDFVKSRHQVCRGTESYLQIAVLHSEHHHRQHNLTRNLHTGADVAPVRGGLFALLENHWSADILDEWALQKNIFDFPVIAVFEQSDMSEMMVSLLMEYVKNGGALLLTGVGVLKRFPDSFVGATLAEVLTDRMLYVPGDIGVSPLYSPQWGLLQTDTASGFGELCTLCGVGDDKLNYPAAIVNQYGKGKVAVIPADVGRSFDAVHYIETRNFIGNVLKEIVPESIFSVQSPSAIDITARQKKGQIMIHLINRQSGIPNSPTQCAVDEIPPAGPVTISLKLAAPPVRVVSAFENASLVTTHRNNTLSITLDQVKIHEAIIIQP